MANFCASEIAGTSTDSARYLPINQYWQFISESKLFTDVTGKVLTSDMARR